MPGTTARARGGSRTSKFLARAVAELVFKMGWTDQIDAMLLAREATRVKRIAFGVLFLVFLIDLAGAIILREAPALLGDDHTVDWTWRGLLDGLQQITDDTVDCLVLYVCRSVLLIFLATK